MMPANLSRPQKIAVPLRNVMEDTKSDFEGSFENDCKLKSVPIQLHCYYILIDGVGTRNEGFSQQSLTIAQLIQSNFKKRTKKKKKNICKISKKRETPCMIYNNLKLYGTVWSKSLIDNFFHLGLCISYDRVLELTKEYADNLVEGYNINQVFCPRTLKRNVFTIIAKDNIDHNARSTTATKHYHVTSMTAMQFLSNENMGETQNPPTYDKKQNMNCSKKVLQIPASYTQPETFYLKKSKFYAPVCTVNIPGEYLDNKIYNQGIDEEFIWLNSLSLQIEYTSWAKHHSEKQDFSVTVPGTNVLLPLIPQPVHTTQTQYHCMKIIKKTSNFLNPTQTPVDCCDEPVYALTKEIQFRLPNEFGADKYFSLFGGLHFEQWI